MKNSKKTLLIVITVIALLAAGGVGGFFLFGKEESAKGVEEAVPAKIEKLYEETKKAAVIEAPDPYDVRIDFEKLKEQNKDVYAWIKVPGTTVDYPILQNAKKADEYYLNTTIDGKKGLPGSIYTEKYNNKEFTDPVTVIYGHNMKDTTMFSELLKYRNKEFFDENPYIYVYLPTGRLKYQIFAAVVFDNRYLMGSYNFNEKQDFEKYITQIKKCFEANINEKVPINNRVLTLSTCTGNSKERYLVNAVLVEAQSY